MVDHGKCAANTGHDTPNRCNLDVTGCVSDQVYIAVSDSPVKWYPAIVDRRRRTLERKWFQAFSLHETVRAIDGLSACLLQSTREPLRMRNEESTSKNKEYLQARTRHELYQMAYQPAVSPLPELIQRFCDVGHPPSFATLLKTPSAPMRTFVDTSLALAKPLLVTRNFSWLPLGSKSRKRWSVRILAPFFVALSVKSFSSLVRSITKSGLFKETSATRPLAKSSKR